MTKEDDAELSRIEAMSDEEILAQMTPEDRANAAFVSLVFAQRHLSNNDIAAILRADIEARRSLRAGAKPN